MTCHWRENDLSDVCAITTVAHCLIFRARGGADAWVVTIQACGLLRVYLAVVDDFGTLVEVQR